jgi:hypothetical protein
LDSFGFCRLGYFLSLLGQSYAGMFLLIASFGKTADLVVQFSNFKGLVSSSAVLIINYLVKARFAVTV